MAVYTTMMSWVDGRHWVTLLRDGVGVAMMTLDEFAKLGAVEFLVEDGSRQAVHEALLCRLRLEGPAPQNGEG